MWIWISVVACLIILLIIAACSKIDIVLRGSKVEADDYLSIKFRMLFGIVKYNYQIRHISFKGFTEGFLVKREQKDNLVTGHESREHFIFDIHFIEDVYDRIDLIIKYTPGFKQWLRQLMRHIYCRQLRWETHVGLADAAETAFVSGTVWAVQGAVTGWFLQSIRVPEQPELIVHTHYHQPQFSTEFRCIAQISFGHAMIAGWLLIVRILRVKGGLKQWRNILFKA